MLRRIMRGLLRGICQDRQVWSLEKQRRRKQTRKPEQRHPVKEENFIIELDWRRGRRMDSYLVIVDGSKDDVYHSHYKSRYQNCSVNFTLKNLSDSRSTASYTVKESSEPRPYRGRRLSDSEIAVRSKKNETDKTDGLHDNKYVKRESRSVEISRRIVHARYCSETEMEETTVDMISTDRGDTSTGGDAMETNTAESETISTDIDEIETVEIHEHRSCKENIDMVMSTLPHRHVLADPSLESQLKIDNLRYGRCNVLRWLLWDTEMPALERSCNGALALHYAAARGCLDCVRLLVEASTELSANTQMDNDVTPVYLAAQEGHLEVLKFLVLEAGGSLYVRAKDGMAPVHAASQMGCLACLKWMVQDQGVDPNLRDGDGATPLHFAASRGHVDCVRWLLRHGAKLIIDKYGKSPINDAAENQQMECLNLLVQHGTTPDYHDDTRQAQGKLHGCTCRKGDPYSKCSYADCVNFSNYREPFFLHPPSVSSGSVASNSSTCSPARDGLYINPMSQPNSDPFYLHDPREVAYNRVKDLFDHKNSAGSTASSHKSSASPILTGLTVKVEVHSSSSGAGSDENLSTSDLSERGSGAGGEHDYEDIYLVREEAGKEAARSRSRDSGSHSRSASVSSSSSNVVIQLTSNSPDNNNNNCNKNNNNNNNKNKNNNVRENDESNVSAESGVSSASPSDLGNSEEEPEKTRHRVSHRNSLPVKHSPNSRALKRAVSEPGACPPPPPPPPPEDLSLPPTLEMARKGSQQSSSRSSYTGDDVSIEEVSAVVETAVSVAATVATSTSSVTASTTVVTTPTAQATVLGSGVGSSVAASDECGPAEELEQQQTVPTQQHVGPNLVNKQMVLPFIPPKFPNNVTNSNGLIKPSEYLRSINSASKTIPASALVQSCSIQHSTATIITTTADHNNKAEVEGKSATIGNLSSSSNSTTLGPPPPPLPALSAVAPQQQGLSTQDGPPSPTAARRLEQPLATISIQDLNSVQLRRTKVLSKTMSAPPRSIVAVNGDQQPYHAQKQDLIEELKMSKDITGIKKLKVERVKMEEQQEKEIVSEIAKQLSVDSFVEKVPEKDATGNPIPPWKRQMLAKKAAEKARKEMEEALARQAEEKRLQSIPAWKRQLMQTKRPEDKSMYIAPPPPPPTTIILEEKRHAIVTAAVTASVVIPATKDNNKENNKPTAVVNKDICTNGQRDIIRVEDEEETTQIIPWRAQLRKTNSTLNLLE